ncbi:signal peptide-containing secreted protein [Cryptosporidium canis]|uniref:Signal peptide-containing secreted protein n=1 Tax=Cryptosporidium canis TaxID=195482 RepID=A0A9D5HZB9_9CRYT|nr:signal peptide-containing secreted protein [Cryptosporidium canis]
MRFLLINFIFLILIILSSFGESVYVSKEKVWELIKLESRRDSSSPSSRVIQNVVGNCPKAGNDGVSSRRELVKLCVDLIMDIVNRCPRPSYQAEYVHYSSGGKSLNIPGVKAVSKFVIVKIAEKFCRLVASQSQFGLEDDGLEASPSASPRLPSSPQLPSPPIPAPPMPAPQLPSPHFPSPPLSAPQLPSTPTQAPVSPYQPITHGPGSIPHPPQHGPTYPTSPYPVPQAEQSLGPISSEWNAIVLGASHGAASRYISAVPSSPFPSFRVGKDIDEKLEQCNKVFREMVRSAISTNNMSVSNGNLVLRVNTMSSENVRVQESLILRTTSIDPVEIKKIIKAFCEAVYSVKEQDADSIEWSKLHQHSLSSSIVQNLPKTTPIFYTISSGADANSLYNSCRKALETLFNSGFQRTSSQSTGTLLLTSSGKYSQLGGSVTSFSSSLVCNAPCTQLEISDSISEFCKSVYFGVSAEQAPRKKFHLQSIYNRLQSTTSLSDSPFGAFPREFPEFLLTSIVNRELEMSGDISPAIMSEVCREILGAIWKNSYSKTPIPRYRSRFSMEGVSKTQAIKLEIDWGGSVGRTMINFPFIEVNGPKAMSFESFTTEFCNGVFMAPSPKPYEKYPAISPDKYIGKSPPFGFPAQIHLIPLVAPQTISSSVLSYSRGVWDRLHKHSSFGIGSASISGLGSNRHMEFVTYSGDKMLYERCYNLIANFYNGASDFRLSSDGGKLSVSRDVNVDQGKGEGQLITGVQKNTLVFIIPGSEESSSLLTLIEKFCKSFITI